MNKLYSELIKAGGFHNALNVGFEKISSVLRVEKVDEDSLFESKITYARIKNNNKFSQVYLASESKMYLPDYWKEGVCLANGSTDNLLWLVKSIDKWLTSTLTTSELANEYSFIKPTDQAIYFDENKEIEQKWKQYLNDDLKQELKPFIMLAKEDDIVGQLFPFTSLNVLCLSRCTGYPYLADTPTIRAIVNEKNKFEVRSENNAFLGEGTAEQALKLVKENLPKGIKRAVKGTADDVKKN